MSWPRVIENLEKGPVQIRPKGNSMTPTIRSGDLVTLRRWSLDCPRCHGSNWNSTGTYPCPDPWHLHQVILETGMTVLAKVKGRYYLHKITKVVGRYPNIERVEISNNHGHVNGWTTPNKVYALVIKIER